nr:MAG TPA: hypothetical protein [Caudoviricetes sp.]
MLLLLKTNGYPPSVEPIAVSVNVPFCVFQVNTLSLLIVM